MKHWNKKTCAGLAVLGALVWMLPVQLPADTTTPQKSASTAKQKPHTASKHSTQSASAGTAKQKPHTASKHSTQSASAGTAKQKPHTPSKHSTQSASAGTGQHQSVHHTATRHLSAKAMQAAARRRRAQLRPEPERIQEIQQALAQAGYLNAQPNGRWDDQTREAMRRYQADHGFPATGLPEAKSLMKLGLGPHPLPPELDASSGARTGAGTVTGTPATPDTQNDPPAARPQP